MSVEFSRQEYWNGLLFPPPGDVPRLGIELVSLVSPLLAGGFFTAEPPGKPRSSEGLHKFLGELSTRIHRICTHNEA